MTNVLKYPALNAKMKGIYAKNLSKEELEELLRQQTLKEAIYFLKNKFPSLDNINESMHRKELEQELNNVFIIEILKLSKYLNIKEKEIFMQFLSKYEIDCIKDVYRNVTTDRESNITLKNIDNWTHTLFRTIDGINQVTEEREFLNIIKDQRYYKIFKQYEDIIEKACIEDIEVQLDKFYFTEVYKLSQNINKEFEEMIGTEIDLLNFIWIYRAKKNFNYTEEEIRNIIIPINYSIKKSKMNKLISANNFDEMKSILNETKYKNVFDSQNEIEQSKNIYLYKIYKKFFKTELFNICTIFCIINLIDIEIKNIINIIEGIRYNVDQKEIQKRLII